MRTPLPLMALVVALAGCGQAQSTSHAGSPTAASAPVASAPAAATPTPDRPLIAVADDGGAGRTTLGLFTLDGRRIAYVTLNASEGRGWSSVGGGMVTFQDGNVLKGLTPSGTVDTLGSLAGWSGGPVIVSPDGQHWMWSAYTSGAAGTSSRLLLGTRGAPDRVVAQQTSVGSVLQPFRWTAAGPTYHSAAMGIGGYILFGDGARGPSYRFDVASGQVTAITTGAGCYLADVAVDGTVACVRSTSQLGLFLVVQSPAGRIVEVPLPRPAFNQEGAITFAPGGTGGRLVIGGATSAGSDTGEERYETELLDVASGQLRHHGPAGLRPAPGPWSWLPDGSLLAYRPAGAFGGDPGIYVVAPDGTAAKVLSSGSPLGVIG